MEKDINKSHIPTTHVQDLVSEKGSEKQGFFYIYKKTEKLASAVYLISTFIPPLDPLFTKLRDTSLRLLSSIVTLRTETAPVPELTERCFLLITELSGLLEVAHQAHYLSDMNYEILQREYTSLYTTLSQTLPSLIEGERRSSQLLDISPLYTLPSVNWLEEIGKREVDKRQLKLHEESVPKTNGKPAQRNRSKGPTVSRENRHQGRKKIILEMLKNKDTITVKDVSSVIKQCSEKTLQRELLAMVDEGVLKKKGERRWSIYSLS